MPAVRSTTKPTRPPSRAIDRASTKRRRQATSRFDPLESGLVDLYWAIVIVVPLALFLKSFWP